jgi:hypothetical protein
MQVHRAKRIDRESPEEAQYRAWVHGERCVGHLFDYAHKCRDRFGSPTDRVEQSHIRFNTGMGQKPPETQSLPMCGFLANQWDEYKGPFRGMTPLQRFAWAKPLLDEHLERFRRCTSS